MAVDNITSYNTPDEAQEAFNATPSLVEQNARAFVIECDEQGIESLPDDEVRADA